MDSPTHPSPAASPSRSEQRYRALVEATSQVVWLATELGTVADDLPTWRAFTGQSYEQLRGFGWMNVIHSDDREQAAEVWKHSLAGAVPHEQEFRVRRADGQYRQVLARAVPIKNDAGKVIEWIGSFSDVTDRRAAQEALHAGREQLRAITDNAPICLAHLDPQCHFRFVNRAYAERFNLAPSDLVGKHLWEVLGPDAYQTLRPHVARVLAGEAVEYETDIDYPVIGRRFMRCRYAPEKDPSGRVTGWVAVVADETQRRRMEQAMRDNERMLAEAQELAHVGSWEMDLGDPDELRVNPIRWSAETYRIFGHTPGHVDATYELFIRHVHEDDRENVAGAIRRAIGEDRPLQIDHRIVRPDGAVRAVQQRGTVARDPSGRALRLIGTCQDVTDRKAAEAQFREQVAENRRLFQQAEQARLQAEQAKAHAEASNKAKDQFLAVLSHELRTPLTPVVMTVAALETEPGLPPHLRDDLAMIRRNIALETRLIDDLLDVSRIINGKMTLHPEMLNVHLLLRGIVDMTASETRAKQIQVRWDLRAHDDQVRADSARLHQVLWNLVKNAIKFTDERGALTLRTANVGQRRIQIQVEDDGIGIDPEVLPGIFNAFDQGELGVTRRFGGLGLGLTISKAIVDLHGGTLIAESEGRGRGARFTLEFPTTGLVERLVNQLSPDPHAKDHARFRVLLVEDHPDTLKMLRRLLETSGYVVTTASSLSAATSLIDSHTFDILVSDIGLPDGTGLELVRSVRARNLTIPGIAITGYGMDHDVQSSLEAGFAAHLTKPVDFDALVTTMRRLVRPTSHPHALP